MSAPRVLVLSSQALFAESLRSLLERDGCEVIGVYAYGKQALGLVAKLKPTVVVLDVHDVPPAATADLLNCAPTIRVVHVSPHDGMIAMYDHQEPASPSVQKFLDLVALRDRVSPDVSESPDRPEEPGTVNL